MAGNIGERTTCTCCGSVLLICANPTCRKTSPRGPREPQTKWGTRMYCSTDCAQYMRQKVRFDGVDPARKTCEQCGKDCVQRPNESPRSFEKRKFCSRECGYDNRRNNATTAKAEAAERRLLRQQRKQEDDKKRAQAAQEALIRKVAVVQPPPPPADVWRPAAWRALDDARR